LSLGNLKNSPDLATKSLNWQHCSYTDMHAYFAEQNTNADGVRQSIMYNVRIKKRLVL